MDKKLSDLSNRLRKLQSNEAKWIKFGIDIFELILVFLIFPFSWWITNILFNIQIDVEFSQGILFLFFIFISWIVFSKITSLAKIPRTRRYLTIIFKFAQITLYIFIILISLKVIFSLTSIPVLLIFNFMTIVFLATVTYRILLFKILKNYRTNGVNIHNVLIIGDRFSDAIIDRLMNQKEWGFKIYGLYTDSKMLKFKYNPIMRIIPMRTSLKRLLDKHIIDEVIYCKQKFDMELIKKATDICNEVGVVFRLQSAVSMFDPVAFQLKSLNKTSDLALTDSPLNKFTFLMKMMADLYFSTIMTFLLFPIFLLMGILIKIDSEGPVFFKQERIGLRGRKFKVFKFRTMEIDAEKKLDSLQARNEAGGPVFKIRDDPRITKVGRFLRKTGLDELPQLLNVVIGDMSLIGPRPPLENEVEQYERWQLRRLSVKPGITCTWQIEPNRHDISFDEWMALDLKYIDNWSLRKDAGLFFKTIKTVFVAGGH